MPAWINLSNYGRRGGGVFVGYIYFIKIVVKKLIELLLRLNSDHLAIQVFFERFPSLPSDWYDTDLQIQRRYDCFNGVATVAVPIPSNHHQCIIW